MVFLQLLLQEDLGLIRQNEQIGLHIGPLISQPFVDSRLGDWS